MSTESPKRWKPVSTETASAHLLYGVKNWLAVFAFVVVATPLLDVGNLRDAADKAGVSALALLAFDSPVAAFTKAVLGVEFVSSGAILWLLYVKHRRLRVLASWILVGRWPAILAASMLYPFEGVGNVMAQSLFPWLISCVIWVTYLQRSKRVRVTFEHCVPTTVVTASLERLATPLPVAPQIEGTSDAHHVIAGTVVKAPMIDHVPVASSRKPLSAIAASLGFLVAAGAIWFAFLRTGDSLQATPSPAPSISPTASAAKLRPLTGDEIAGVFSLPRYVPPSRLSKTRPSNDFDFDALLGVTEEDKKAAAVERVAAAERDARDLPAYRNAAAQGDVAAQVELARIYRSGSSVKQDDKTALEWEWMAAIQGNAASAFDIGDRYANGGNVEKNRQRAMAWYGQAAERGNADAQYALSGLYVMGDGVPQDYQKAMTWALKAAEQGDSSAQYRVGLWYSKGQGTTQSKVDAHKWLNLAAADRHVAASKARDKLEKKMSSGEIAEAHRRASAWLTARK